MKSTLPLLPIIFLFVNLCFKYFVETDLRMTPISSIKRKSPGKLERRNDGRKYIVETMSGKSYAGVNKNGLNLRSPGKLKKRNDGRKYIIETMSGKRYAGVNKNGLNLRSSPASLKKKTEANILSGNDYADGTSQMEAYIGSEAHLKCASSLPFIGCRFISPRGDTYIIGGGRKYENGRIECLCVAVKYDPSKVCGIRITDLKAEDKGEWSCEIDIVQNGCKQTAGSKVMLVPKKNPHKQGTTGSVGTTMETPDTEEIKEDMVLQIEEGTEKFEEKCTYKRDEGTLEVNVPAHNDYPKTKFCFDDKSSSVLQISGGKYMLSSLPPTLTVKEFATTMQKMENAGGSSDKDGVSPDKKTNTINTMKMRGTCLTKKRRAELPKKMQTWSENNQIVRAVECPITSEEMKVLLTGEILLKKITITDEIEIVTIDTSNLPVTTISSTWATKCKNGLTAIKKPTCNVKTACSKTGPDACGYGWPNPDPKLANKELSFHQVSSGSICCDCCVDRPGPDDKICQCNKITDKEKLMDCKLNECGVIVIDVGPTIQMTFQYNKDNDQRALMFHVPAFDKYEELMVIMHASNDGQWHRDDLKNNYCVKIGDICYISTLAKDVFPVDWAVGLQDLAGDTITKEDCKDKFVVYNANPKANSIDDTALHEDIKNQCKNLPIKEFQEFPLTIEEFDVYMTGKFVEKEPLPDCWLVPKDQGANGLGCIWWPNVDSGDGEDFGEDSGEEVVVQTFVWVGEHCCKERVPRACKKRYPQLEECGQQATAPPATAPPATAPPATAPPATAPPATTTAKAPCTWDSWGEWSSCDVTCGTGGRKERTRICGNCRRCRGKTNSFISCDAGPC